MRNRETVTVQTTVAFQALRVPNFISLAPNPRDGARSEHSIPIEDVDEEALHALVEALLEDLYEKAGKTNPFERPLTP